MPKISPRTRRALIEPRKTQIVTAAVKVFAAKGFERATIADIAKEAGVAEGSIYNYFKSKGDLLISIPRQAVQPRVQSLRALSEGSVEETLTAITRLMMSGIRENAPNFRILLSSLPRMDQKMREQYCRPVVLYAVGVLQAYLQEQTRRGVLQPDLDPAILSPSRLSECFFHRF